MLNRFIPVALVIFLLFGCIGGDNNPPINQTNTSIISNPTTLEVGDVGYVDYTLVVDGKVLDTSNAILANQSGVYNSNRQYGPMRFTAISDCSIIPCFISNTLGMKINESKTFTVPPLQGYGAVDPKHIYTISRYYNQSLFEYVPRADLEAQGLNISNGTTFETNIGMVSIHDINETTVTLFYLLLPGSSFEYLGFPNMVLSLSNNIATIERDLVVNTTYSAPNPDGTGYMPFRVIDKTDSNITLDSNHILAGKTLVFTVKLVGLEKKG